MLPRDSLFYQHGVLLVVALTAALSACKQPEKRQPPPVYRDAYLQGFMEEFLADAAAHGRPVSDEAIDKLRVVKFVDDISEQKRNYGQPALDGEDLAGACTDVAVDSKVDAKAFKWRTAKVAWQEIWINAGLRAGPKPASNIAMRELMYHELGHCLFGFAHAPEKPHTFMSPQVLDNPMWLEKNWERLEAEFFKAAPAP